jgi:hypothetical protein
MRNKSTRKLLAFLMTTAILGFGCHGHEANSSGQQDSDAPGFKEFSDRLNDYVKIHKAIESGLPTVKSNDLPEMITAHQLALARKIRESRPNAQTGDIFTLEARKSFQHVIRGVMLSPQGTSATATMNQGAPLADNPMRVNEPYPDKLPVTTVPPTLLAALPKLPDQVEYRLVGHDLILLDPKANMVVDIFAGVIP